VKATTLSRPMVVAMILSLPSISMATAAECRPVKSVFVCEGAELPRTGVLESKRLADGGWKWVQAKAMPTLAPKPETRPPETPKARIPKAVAAPRPTPQISTTPAIRDKSTPAPRPAKSEAKVEAQKIEPKSETADGIYSRRSKAECSPGWTGIVCREIVKFEICSGSGGWSENPPAGRSICRRVEAGQS